MFRLKRNDSRWKTDQEEATKGPGSGEEWESMRTVSLSSLLLKKTVTKVKLHHGDITYVEIKYMIPSHKGRRVHGSTPL